MQDVHSKEPAIGHTRTCHLFLCTLPVVQGALYSCVANSSGKQKGKEKQGCWLVYGWVPGPAVGPQSSHAPPHIQLPMLVPKGTPRPALTCLIVVIDLHLSWLQALHRDVPLHREGKAQGLVVQLGKRSSGGLGVPLHLPWSLLVSPHWPHSTSALPATSGPWWWAPPP